MKEVQGTLLLSSRSPSTSKIDKILKETKQRLFNVLFILLKNTHINLWFELLCIVFQLIQLLAFSLHPIFASIWKCNSLYLEISNILQYFQMTSFSIQSKELYLIALYFNLLFVFFLYLIIFNLSFSFANNNSLIISFSWTFLKPTLSLLTTTLYIPIINSFLFIFSCVNTDKSIAQLQCYSPEFIAHGVFAVIGALLLFFLSLFSTMTYFETDFSGDNPLSKSTTRADVCLLCIKTLLIIIFTFFCNESTTWLLIASIVFLSCYLTFTFYDIRPYYHASIRKMHVVLSVMFSWSGIVLLIGWIFQTTLYDGSLALLILGAPIIILSIYYEKDNILSELLSSKRSADRGDKHLEQINTFLQLINKRNSTRKAKIELKGYILQFEEKCILLDCPLKKYLSSLSYKEADILIYLFQHVEGMFESALTKFPSCVALRSFYALFLLGKMNKKKQAELELNNAENCNSNLEEQFVIFRYKKFIDEYSTELNNSSSSFTINNKMDVVSDLAYKNYQSLFKSSIEKASALYIDFWSLLLHRDADNHQDLAKLNDYGTDINSRVETIHNFFYKMQKLKPNDLEVIKHYSDFLNDILNDKDKASHYKNKLANYTEEAKDGLNEELNPANCDLNTLSTNDEYQCIIASAQPDKFGLITNISLGICNLFGYTKHELIGKTIDMIMPDVYHKGHKEVLIKKLNELKKTSVELHDAFKNSKPTYREIKTFGKNKSRYLIPLLFKTSVISTENNDIIFIAKIWKDPSLVSFYSPQQSCFILTNNSLIIQTFTVNALTLLGMKSSAINGNIEITEFIKQFHEEYLYHMIELGTSSLAQKILMKRSIIGHKYRMPSFINWKHNDQTDIKLQASRCYDSTNQDNNPNALTIDSFLSMKRATRTREEFFLLSITDIIINCKQEGYLFRFDSVNEGSTPMIRAKLSMCNDKFPSFNNTPSSNVNVNDYKKRSTNMSSYFVTKEATNEDNVSSRAKIPASFIPEPNENIQFDPKSYSFKIKAKTPIELREQLKREAFRKIQQTHQQLGEQSIESSSSVNDEGEYSENNEEESSELSMSNSNAQNSNEQSSKAIRTIPNSRSNEDAYYKVNMNHIKYSVYDYSKQMIVEVKDYEKVDRVQLKLTSFHPEGEDELASDVKSNKQESNSAFPSSQNVSISFTSQKDISDQKTKHTSLIKKIEYSLGKEESQLTIIKMKWICFCIFIVFLLFGSGALGLFISSFDIINENIILIVKTNDLLRLNHLGTYYVRELTLLNNINFTAIPDQRDAYQEQIFNATRIIFTLSNDDINYIITSSLKLSTNSSLLIFNTTFLSGTIEETDTEFAIKYYNLSLVVTFLETNTALLHIGHTILDKIIPTNKDVFYYLYNSLNGIPIALKHQRDVLSYELKSNIAYVKQIMFLFLLTLFVVLIGVYFLLAHGYDGISKRKESYLEVFFEIGSNVIKSSLEKCENFLKKIQIESIHDDLSIDNNENSTLVSKEKSRSNSASSANALHLHKKHKWKNSYNKNSKEAIRIKALFIVVLVCIVFFTFMSFIFYSFYMNEVLIMMTFQSYMIQQHNEYLMLFNGLREFMFDSNSTIQWNSSIDYLGEIFAGIYYVKRERAEFIQTNIDYTPDRFSSKYIATYKESACINDDNYYSTLHQCESIMSNSTIFGLEVALMYFIEDIRFAKNYAIEYKQNQSLTGQIYNLTLTGTTKGELWPIDDPNKIEEYKQHDSINLFLHRDVHYNINMMFILVLIPNFEQLSSLLKDNYALSLHDREVVYMIIFGIYLGLIVGGYVLLWLPYESKMNQTIYKTKNMLSIIPKEVLASLTNIHRILNISKVGPSGLSISN